MQIQIAYQEVLQVGSRRGAKRRTCNAWMAEVLRWLVGSRASEADPRPKHDGSGWMSSGIDGFQRGPAFEEVAADHYGQPYSQNI